MEYIIEDIINKMIEAQDSNHVAADIGNTLSRKEYIREFRTLHVRLGRRTGKTYWAKKMIEGTNAVVFVPNTHMHHQLYNYGRNVYTTTDLNSACNTPGPNLNIASKTIIVDEPKLCSAYLKGVDLETAILNNCNTDLLERIILLGE